MVREKSHRVQSHLKHTTTAFEVVQGYRLTYTVTTNPIHAPWSFTNVKPRIILTFSVFSSRLVVPSEPPRTCSRHGSGPNVRIQH